MWATNSESAVLKHTITQPVSEHYLKTQKANAATTVGGKAASSKPMG